MVALQILEGLQAVVELPLVQTQLLLKVGLGPDQYVKLVLQLQDTGVRVISLPQNLF